MTDIKYIGLTSLVQNDGDSISLENFNHCKRLVKINGDYLLMSNVCTHKNAIIQRGKSSGTKISCPFHKWTFDSATGKLLNTPGMTLCNNHDLDSVKLHNLNGILFEAISPMFNVISESKLKNEIPDLSNYHLNRRVVDKLDCSWNIFVETYLDLYHIKFIHKSLSNIVENCDLDIEIGEYWSIQRQSCKIGTDGVYAKYLSALHQYDKNIPLEIKWILIYLNIMIEIYPSNNVVVSIAIPSDEEGKCINIIEFYNNKELENKILGISNLHEEAYLLTALEDIEMTNSVQIGRKLLIQNGYDVSKNINHPVLESAVEHFYKTVFCK